MTHVTHRVCGRCKVSKTCKFIGNPRLALGEVIANPLVSQTNPEVCSRYRCGKGEYAAIQNIRASAQGKIRWEERIVDGKPAKVLEVTTDVKEGFVDSNGEFVTEDGGKLKRTGQMMNPRMLKLAQKHINDGINKSFD